MARKVAALYAAIDGAAKLENSVKQHILKLSVHVTEQWVEKKLQPVSMACIAEIRINRSLEWHLLLQKQPVWNKSPDSLW